MPTDGPPTSPDVRTAAVNAVAVASLAHTQTRMALGSVLACAHSHGLDVDQLCDASGLDEPFVRRLLAEAGR